jgi:hypothetical protein
MSHVYYSDVFSTLLYRLRVYDIDTNFADISSEVQTCIQLDQIAYQIIDQFIVSDCYWSMV